MKKLILASLMALNVFGYEATSVDVDFKAFKTPMKKGVKGSFDHVELHSHKGASLKEMLLGTSVMIQTSSVDSKNKARDKKLVEHFFNVQNVKTITAKITKVEGNVLHVAISMNGKTLDVPMKYEVEKNEVEAEGVVDLADFNMLPALHSITKACYDLHQGKTWQDVELEFELQYNK